MPVVTMIRLVAHVYGHQWAEQQKSQHWTQTLSATATRHAVTRRLATSAVLGEWRMTDSDDSIDLVDSGIVGYRRPWHPRHVPRHRPNRQLRRLHDLAHMMCGCAPRTWWHRDVLHSPLHTTGTRLPVGLKSHFWSSLKPKDGLLKKPKGSTAGPRGRRCGWVV